MSDAKKSTLLSWAPVAITLAGWIFFGGAAYATLKDHEKRITKAEADHDTLITMNQKLSDVHEWMKAMRDRAKP